MGKGAKLAVFKPRKTASNCEQHHTMTYSFSQSPLHAHTDQQTPNMISSP